MMVLGVIVLVTHVSIVIVCCGVDIIILVLAARHWEQGHCKAMCFPSFRATDRFEDNLTGLHCTVFDLVLGNMWNFGRHLTLWEGSVNATLPATGALLEIPMSLF